MNHMSLRHYLVEHLGNLDVINKEILNAFHGKALTNQITKFNPLASSDVKYRQSLVDLGKNSKVEHTALSPIEIIEIFNDKSVGFVVLCDKTNRQIAWVARGLSSISTTKHFDRTWAQKSIFKKTYSEYVYRKEQITHLYAYAALMFFDQLAPNEVEKYKTLSPTIKETKIKCIVVYVDKERIKKQSDRVNSRKDMEIKPTTNFTNYARTKNYVAHSYRDFTKNLLSQFNNRKIAFKLEKNKLNPGTIMGHVQTKGYVENLNFMNNRYDFSEDRIRIRDIENKQAYVKYHLVDSEDSFKDRRNGMHEYYSVEPRSETLSQFLMAKQIPPRYIKFILGMTGGAIHATDVVYEYE